MGDRLTSDRAIRLLRAKAGELENAYKSGANVYPGDLAADIALVATLLADHMELDHG